VKIDTASVETATRVRVGTFNIRHGEGLDGVVDIRRTAGVIAEMGVDLLALQEIDRGMERSGGLDQPRALTDATGLMVRFFPLLERGGEYGIGLACRDGVEVHLETLPRSDSEEPRGVLHTRWRGLTILATHLSRQEEARRDQIQFLARLAGDLEPPVVVMGDLNDTRRALGPLRAAGLDPGGRPRPTLASSFARREVDHLLAGRGARVERAWTLRTRVSDHLPLVGEVSVAR
jgi:endonuclease/exonuclease/phosphatase family metal-dependent hydrolase